MGRIVAQVEIENGLDPESKMAFSALVDTGAAYLSLPSAWKARLGNFPRVKSAEVETATGQSEAAELAGPVLITVEGFAPFYSEVLFVPMNPSTEGNYEPLLGYIPLEQGQIAVDMLGHRLLATKRIDLK